MVPIPVRNVNLRVGSKRPNMNRNPSDEEDDHFSHRFFWFDISSGLTDDDTASGTPSVLRYAYKMYLKVPLRKVSSYCIYQYQTPMCIYLQWWLVHFNLKCVSRGRKRSFNPSWKLLMLMYNQQFGKLHLNCNFQILNSQWRYEFIIILYD